VVAGIGHEVDFTLTDFAADVRAPTPSAAAELVTPLTTNDLRAVLKEKQKRLMVTMEGEVVSLRRNVEQAATSLQLLSPQHQIDAMRQRLDGLMDRATRAVDNDLHLHRERLAGTRRALDAMNPSNILARGYAIVRSSDGKILRRAVDAPPSSAIAVRLQEGQLWATVDRQEE
jgi:exodeoxyribonuclease VII large subunit